MKRVSARDIETAIALTEDRWGSISKAETLEVMCSVMHSTKCGFCKLAFSPERGCLNTNGCLYGKCPIEDHFDKNSCCKAWYVFDKARDDSTVPIIKREAELLIKRMAAFNIPKIVREINKAIKKEEAENASDKT